MSAASEDETGGKEVYGIYEYSDPVAMTKYI
jgi:hypothetical protein